MSDASEAQILIVCCLLSPPIFCLSVSGRYGVSPMHQPGLWKWPGSSWMSASPRVVPWHRLCQPPLVSVICLQPCRAVHTSVDQS